MCAFTSSKVEREDYHITKGEKNGLGVFTFLSLEVIVFFFNFLHGREVRLSQENKY